MAVNVAALVEATGKSGNVQIKQKHLAALQRMSIGVTDAPCMCRSSASFQFGAVISSQAPPGAVPMECALQAWGAAGFVPPAASFAACTSPVVRTVHINATLSCSDSSREKLGKSTGRQVQ